MTILLFCKWLVIQVVKSIYSYIQCPKFVSLFLNIACMKKKKRLIHLLQLRPNLEVRPPIFPSTYLESSWLSNLNQSLAANDGIKQTKLL